METAAIIKSRVEEEIKAYIQKQVEYLRLTTGLQVAGVDVEFHAAYSVGSALPDYRLSHARVRF